MPRSIPEWIAKHDDQAIPEKVQNRVFERYERKCAICGNEIHPGDGTDFDHATPLADGGEHREANLRPVHRKCHRLKTAREAQERAISRYAVRKHYGFPKQPRGFRKAEPQRSATRPLRHHSEERNPS